VRQRDDLVHPEALLLARRANGDVAFPHLFGLEPACRRADRAIRHIARAVLTPLRLCGLLSAMGEDSLQTEPFRRAEIDGEVHDRAREEKKASDFQAEWRHLLVGYPT